MNRSPLNKTDIAAWQELLGTPAAPHTAGLAALFLASLLVLPLCGNSKLALLYLALTAVILYFISHSVSYVIRALLPAVLLYFLAGSMQLPAIWAALILGSSCGVMLLVACKDKRYLLLVAALPVIAFAAAYSITGDSMRALLTLLPLPLVIGGYVLLRRCTPHTTAAITLAAILIATLAATGLIALDAADMLSGNPLTMLGDALRNTVTALMHEFRAVYAEAGVEFPFSDTDIGNLAAILVNLLPGIIGAVAVTAAHLLWRTMLQFLLGLNIVNRLPLRLRVMTVSPITAGIFILSYVFSLIANSETTTLAGTVASNLTLLLVPALTLVGFAALFHRDRPRSCLSTLLTWGVIAAVIFNPAVGLLIAAFYGAVSILLQALASRAKKKD